MKYKGLQGNQEKLLINQRCNRESKILYKYQSSRDLDAISAS